MGKTSTIKSMTNSAAFDEEEKSTVGFTSDLACKIDTKFIEIDSDSDFSWSLHKDSNQSQLKIAMARSVLIDKKNNVEGAKNRLTKEIGEKVKNDISLPIIDTPVPTQRPHFSQDVIPMTHTESLPTTDIVSSSIR